MGPRRIVLDALLVEAAVAAGAELREGFTVKEILTDDGRVTGIRGHAKGGETVTERANVVIGADGKHSLVAKAVGARAVQRAAAAHARPTTRTGAGCRRTASRPSSARRATAGGA